VYITNPNPAALSGPNANPTGGPVLLAYQNLISLLLPRLVSTQRPSTVR